MISSLPAILTPRPGRRSATDRPQERAFRALVRTIGLLDRVMQPHFARFGISSSQWAALRVLHRAESDGRVGLRITELSERLLIRPPSVTGVVDRLERGGLVLRDAAVDDLRAKQVRLTAKGRRLVENILVVHPGQIEAVLGGLSATDQSELHRLLDKLAGHVERMLDQGARGN